MHSVYIIRNLVNGWVYVGQTSNFTQRKASHLYSARKGDHRPLYRAMREDGIDNFVFEVLEECVDAQAASSREEYWVHHYNSFEQGYNLTRGGGFHVGNKGRQFTEEHKQKISAAHKGKVLSVETREKLRIAASRRRGKKHPMFGKHFSPEARENMSAGRKRAWERQRQEND